MNIVGKTKIWRKDWDNNRRSYSILLKNKNQEGKEEKLYMQVQFPKDVILENGQFIDIKKSFLSFYENKLLQPTIKLVITEFEKIDYDNNNVYTQDNTITQETDGLPF
jgi:hypothetical protein